MSDKQIFGEALVKARAEPLRFTIEDGILYYGRTDLMHGYNLGHISDISFNALKILNAPLYKVERLEAALKAIGEDE